MSVEGDYYIMRRFWNTSKLYTVIVLMMAVTSVAALIFSWTWIALASGFAMGFWLAMVKYFFNHCAELHHSWIESASESLSDTEGDDLH